MLRLTFVFIFMAAFLASPALAQSKKELAAQNAALAQRLSVLESRMLTGDPAAERLMQRVDALESSQRTLTGEVEQLRFERDKLRAEVVALSEDLRTLEEMSEQMTAHMNAAPAPQYQSVPQYQTGPVYQGQPQFPSQTQPGPTEVPRYNTQPRVYGGAPDAGGVNASGLAGQPSAIPGPPTLGEQTIPIQEQYQSLAGLPASGKQKLAEGDFTGAQIDFRQYLDNLPDAPDAGEVSFWLGETYFVKGAHADAADAYINAMRKGPSGVKAPDAMVRLAAALRELGKTAEACQTLDSFPAQYPNAPASVREKARTELARTGC